MTEKMIPGLLAAAFMTRRKMFLTMFEKELREKKNFSEEDIEQIINALTMTCEELWRHQTAVRTSLLFLDDLEQHLAGIHVRMDNMRQVLNEATEGRLPEDTANEVIARFKSEKKKGKHRED